MQSNSAAFPVISAAFQTSRDGCRILRHLIRPIVSVVLGLMLVVAAAFAQVETGQISGTVTDESGAVVPNATVTVKNLASNAQRTTTTSPTGSYVVVGLQPGTYQVSVSSEQFKPFTSNIEVTVGARATLDAKLSVNAAVTEVQVVAEGGAQVNTTTQEVSQLSIPSRWLPCPASPGTRMTSSRSQGTYPTETPERRVAAAPGRTPRTPAPAE